MPRTARKATGSNIFHVMLRGINRQNIFEEDEDRFYFMTVLNRCRELSGFTLHAFVLMSNHVHLLIEPADEPLATIFKRVGTRYAVWYNRKYQRSGHLFQDRFRSENVGTDQYYMTVLRYILQNPMKAGLESRPGTYRWSSFLAYARGRGSLTDTEYAVNLFGSREALIDFVLQDSDDSAMDEADHDWCIRDDTAKEMISRMTGCNSVSDYQNLDSVARKEFAVKLYLEGLSMGQIARLTGMTKSMIYRAIHKAKDESCAEESSILSESDAVYDDAGIIW